MKLAPQIIDELVRRVTNASQPDRILLFGSAARDELNAESDLDVLVIVAPGIHRRRTAQELHQHMRGFPLPVDFVVATADDIRLYGDRPGLIYRRVLAEGLTIYERR